MAVCMTPLAAGLLALRWVKFPFLTVPIAFTHWYMSMDLASIGFEKDDYSWDDRKVV